MQDVISRTIIKGCSRPGAEQVRHTLPNSLKILVIFSGLRKFFILMEDEKEKKDKKENKDLSSFFLIDWELHVWGDEIKKITRKCILNTFNSLHLITNRQSFFSLPCLASNNLENYFCLFVCFWFVIVVVVAVYIFIYIIFCIKETKWGWRRK